MQSALNARREVLANPVDGPNSASNDAKETSVENAGGIPMEVVDEAGKSALTQNFQVPSDKFSGHYELMGVVTHKGRSADSGHYIGWVRQHPGSNFWWKFDDEKVSEVSTSEILKLCGGDSHLAYLNIYRFKEL